MRNVSLRRTRGMLVLLAAILGFMSLTASPVAAQGTRCVSGDQAATVRLFDDDNNGATSIAELRAFANGLSDGNSQKAQLLAIIADAEASGISELRFDGTGVCAPPTATSAPATTAPTSVPATSTTVPGTATATTVPGTETATTVPGTETATTVPGTATATTVPGTETATTVPDDDGDDDGGDDGVSELPDTGQGSAAEQGNATILATLLGGMALCIAGAFFWARRRAA